jgi:hypothetical protein
MDVLILLIVTGCGVLKHVALRRLAAMAGIEHERQLGASRSRLQGRCRFRQSLMREIEAAESLAVTGDDLEAVLGVGIRTSSDLIPKVGSTLGFDIA